jgi:tripartite-type tricarboxylate transporter receptor subunit TctC
VIDNIRTGKLRALAVTSAMRSDALPDVPPLGERKLHPSVCPSGS